MLPLIGLTLFFLVVMVLVGLLARRIDRQREEESSLHTSHGHHA